MTPALQPADAASPPVRQSAMAIDRLDAWPYSSAVRAERLLALARLVLALFGFMTIFVEPDEPAKHVHVSNLLLSAYAAYSAVLLGVVWTSTVRVRPLQILTQVVDLALYTLFIYLTDGFTSPIFAFLVFSILCATVRWQGRGALIAASAAIAAYICLGLYFYLLPPRDPTFALDRFIFRAVYLAVLAGLMTSVGAYEGRIARELRRLAAWPRPIAAGREEVLRHAIGYAARILQAPRVLLVVEEAEEPWQHLALWSAGHCEFRRVPPQRYGAPVVEALERTPFMCRDAGAADVRVLFASGEGVRERRGPAIDQSLRTDFAMRSVLALPLPGERLVGWVFYLDKPTLSTDDIALGTITAREIAASLDHADMLAMERQTAVTDERIRLGRDLHDGLLQSLTAARLQLHQLSRQAATGAESREKLLAVEASIAANQRDLRRLVEELRPRDEGSLERRSTLADDLDELRSRVRQEWGLDVQASLAPRLDVPAPLRREVHLMVNEALVNAARHGSATLAEVSVSEDAGCLAVTVSDNGRGFPFHGRRTAEQLANEPSAPFSLRQRVMALRGSMVVESGPKGARVEMTIPVERGA